MRKVFGALAGAALLAAAPVGAMAQDRNKDAASEPTAEEIADVFSDLTLFELEIDPLTPEQEARLPAAERVALQLMPEGSFLNMMSGQLRPTMEAMVSLEMADPFETLTELTGLPRWRVYALDEDAASRAVSILDPRRAEREAATLDWMMGMLEEMFTLLEPHYRTGLSRAIAVEFTAGELAEMETFFATPVGARYASNSYLLYSSPHVLDAMNQIGPAMGEIFPRLMEEMVEIEERFGSARAISDLPQGELSELAGLFGISSQQLLSEAADPYAEIELEIELGED